MDKKEFENWKKFLIQEKMTNLVRYPDQDGWELYAKLVADAYREAPAFEERAKESFDLLAPFYDKMHKRITKKAIKPRPVDYHPYDVGGGVEDVTSVDRLRKDYEDTGGIEVARIDSEHPVLSPDENVRARAVHDYMSTEVIGQVCHFYVYEDFIEQKVALLDGFDYLNPGIVYPETGYKNVGRRLVPINKEE